MFLEQIKRLIIEHELKEKKDSLEKQRDELKTQLGSLSYNSFGFIQKNITKRKQYREEKALATRLKNEIYELGLQLEGNNFSGQNFSEIRQAQIENAKTLQDLGLTFEQAIELMRKNGIEPKFESCREALEIGGEKLATNVEFMKRALMEDPRFIIYDKTNNKDLYIDFINSIIAKIKGNENNLGANVYVEMAEALKEEIKKPKDLPKGRYKIKQEDIFEGIRGYAKETSEERKDADSNWGITVLSATKASIDMSERVLREDGEKLESIYDSQANFFVHGGADSFRSSVFSNGLRATGQSPLYRNLYRTAKPISSFLGLIGYHYQNTGTILEGNFIIKIPSNTKYIWGSNSQNGEIENSYLLPEFIVGELDFSHNKPKDEPVRLIENDMENKAKYKYFYKDGSALGDKPKIIELEDMNI